MATTPSVVHLCPHIVRSIDWDDLMAVPKLVRALGIRDLRHVSRCSPDALLRKGVGREADERVAVRARKWAFSRRRRSRRGSNH